MSETFRIATGHTNSLRGHKARVSEFIQPAELPISRYEIDMGLIRAPEQYALIENAYAHAHKLTRESHQELINNEWEEMARIADSIPSSWIRDAHDH